MLGAQMKGTGFSPYPSNAIALFFAVRLKPEYRSRLTPVSTYRWRQSSLEWLKTSDRAADTLCMSPEL